MPTIFAVACLLLAVNGAFAQQAASSRTLHEMSGRQLMAYTRTHACGCYEYSDWELAQTIRKKFSPKTIIAMYSHEPAKVRDVFVLALLHDRGREISAFMRKVAGGVRPGMTTETNDYFPLQYLAQECDPWALKQLNRDANFKDSYPVSCMFWQDTLTAFGRCGYEPAEAHLAMSFPSACLNNTSAALKSLRRLIPDSDCYKLMDANDSFQRAEDCYLRAIRKSKMLTKNSQDSRVTYWSFLSLDWRLGR